MAFHTWQIGLDIQNRQLCALAVQRRREGWQLCHWWQQRLPQDTLRNGVLQSSPELLAALTTWRKRLPKRYSLRVGLPEQLVLQRCLPLPAQPLREPALRCYVQAAAQKLFPVAPEALALDYRLDSQSGQLCVTAARQAVIDQWLAPLRQAGLKPSIFDLTTHALQKVTEVAQLSPGCVLVLPRETGWLWCEGRGVACSSDVATLAELQQLFPQPMKIYLCDTAENARAREAEPFSPFALLRYQQPPLPDCSGEFTLAAGLALRKDDH
ncbi:pilus assembly protein PilM [Pantoea sp. LMR881]|uniref:type IV pilus biogenesis protein PilM n=1 Tax=Pantoea sp. LMR881 TaxID=3014336 RepID=UPI0022AEA229|nr:pilus assembly protein PilM [Pantoea sp. LMR881]MCZ4059962.1 pilus assembly protein PilM [Pantoea sp. LMR881]